MIVTQTLPDEIRERIAVDRFESIPDGAAFRCILEDGTESGPFVKRDGTTATDEVGRVSVWARYPSDGWSEEREAFDLRMGHRAWVMRGRPVPSVASLCDPSWRKVTPRDGWGLDRLLWLNEHPELVRPSDCIQWHARKSDTVAPLEVGIFPKASHV